ncbi:E3 ubiquitin-protein ligase UHRF1-like [Sitophilus oryzae]|uniref:RING-type E3 ubiquitin transferase n=1 Tax=Sitophilus oryzae TaxID=7048 RepID=A0A6J2YD74_SITOR|nr:E3 ubiquitin-protein ligase UHRF1-like [Sitophilus oryzae]
MYIRIKADWLEDKSKRESVIPLSKTTTIEELRKLVFSEIDLEPNLQRLFYKGKELVNGHNVNDYSILPNDVIVVFKRQIIVEQSTKDDVLSTPSTIVEEESESKPVAKDVLVKTVSDFYDVNDLVDVRFLDTGAWYEASIIDVFRKESDEKVKEEHLVFRVKSAEHVSIVPFEEDVEFSNIRPRSYYTYKIPELSPGMRVLVNYNIDSPRSRGLWYDFEISKVASVDVIGKLFIVDGSIDDCNIKFIQEVMRIEETKPKKSREEVKSHKKRVYPYYCEKCKDNKMKLCKACGCKICGGKNDWDKIVLCDECDQGHHTTCLNPPLEAIPDDDWYCPQCKTDDSEIVKPGEKLKKSKKKQNMPSQVKDTKRDWGKGMACVGLTKRNDKVSKTHVGAIPGVEVGFCWKFRHGVAESGVHRPPVAGIHGQESDCAYSIVLSGGYEDDIDYGNEFFYTGSGGRDLSGNKRTSNQSFDQELTRTNKALALNCNAPFNDKEGAEATDWKSGKPVRVVRSYKLAKHSKYAPEDGYRYDGLYKVVKYYPEKGKSGFMVWRYFLRRDDPALAPWEENAKQYEMIYPEGYLAFEEAKKKKEETENKKITASKKSSPKKGHKRKTTSGPLDNLLNKKKKVEVFKIDSAIEKAIKEDTVNEKLWIECKSAVKNGKKAFLDKVEEIFQCIICIELVFNPVTLKCRHNLCQICLKESFKHSESDSYFCPHCRESLDKSEATGKLPRNEKLSVALNLLFPGYGTK